MSYIEPTPDAPENPIDVIEQLFSGRDWPIERGDDGKELTIIVTSKWMDYQVSYTWMDEIDAVHLACAFDLSFENIRKEELQRLVGLMNEQMWIGHFDLWADQRMILFRHALPVPSGEAFPEQCSALLEHAVSACDQYFPAFQYVAWAGKPAKEALSAALFQTEGTA